MPTSITQKNLTQESVDGYILEDGHVCPLCSSKNIEALEPPVVESAVCTQFLRCNDCDETWSDIYRLVALHTDRDGTIYGTEMEWKEKYE